MDFETAMRVCAPEGASLVVAEALDADSGYDLEFEHSDAVASGCSLETTETVAKASPVSACPAYSASSALTAVLDCPHMGRCSPAERVSAGREPAPALSGCEGPRPASDGEIEACLWAALRLVGVNIVAAVRVQLAEVAAGSDAGV